MPNYSPPLYQLSYREIGMLPSMRIELTTLGLLDPRSNQLSYEGYSVTSNRCLFHKSTRNSLDMASRGMAMYTETELRRRQ